MIPPCLTLSNIGYKSRVKWSNPGEGVAPSPTLWCSSYWKGSPWSPSSTVANFTEWFRFSLWFTIPPVPFPGFWGPLRVHQLQLILRQRSCLTAISVIFQSPNVAYWPPTRPGYQNRKCTCVNNRCILSRNIRIL